jgi:hypothetical protein
MSVRIFTSQVNADSMGSMVIASRLLKNTHLICGSPLSP